MLYKYFGSVLLLGSAVYYSWDKLKRDKLQIDVIAGCIDFLQYIYRNIECFQKPLPEILNEYNNTSLNSFGFLDALKQNDLYSASEKLKDKLSEEAYSVMESYLQSAGKGYKDEELQLCRYTAGFLQKILENMKEDSKNHTKMIKTLPFMFALSLVMLLW